MTMTFSIYVMEVVNVTWLPRPATTKKLKNRKALFDNVGSKLKVGGAGEGRLIELIKQHLCEKSRIGVGCTQI